MNTKKIIDYIQVLFWILVLVAGATGAYTHFAWGYIDWVVVEKTVIVFANTFAWIIFIREAKIFKYKKTEPLSYIIPMIFIIVVFMGDRILGNEFWKLLPNDPENSYLYRVVAVSVFFISLQGLRYGLALLLLSTVLYYFTDKYYKFDLIEYAYYFVTLLAGSFLSLTLKYVSKKLIFRRWSDIAGKKEKPVKQK